MVSSSVQEVQATGRNIWCRGCEERATHDGVMEVGDIGSAVITECSNCGKEEVKYFRHDEEERLDQLS